MQTNYDPTRTQGVEGAAVDDVIHSNNSAYVQKRVIVGRACSKGNTDKQVHPWYGKHFRGVVLWTESTMKDKDTGLTEINEGGVCTVRQRGRTWVHSNKAVTLGEPAYILNYGSQAGRFTPSPSGATPVPNGTWANNTTGAGLAILEVL